DGEPLIVAPTPEFYRWTFASMWTPGPFEAKPSRAYYYLTDADRSWPAERQEEHLRYFNYPILWHISIHEAYPGHFLHFQHLRQVESKVRKSVFFASASLVEGWAHYCEQMMVEAGFRRNEPEIKLGQLAEALVRLARFIVCFLSRGSLFEERLVAEGSRTRHVRSDVSRLLRRQADDAEAAARLQGAAGRQVLAARVPRRRARAGVRAVF